MNGVVGMTRMLMLVHLYKLWLTLEIRLLLRDSKIIRRLDVLPTGQRPLKNFLSLVLSSLYIGHYLRELPTHPQVSPRAQQNRIE